MLIKGVVRKGKERGKELGFPTANIPLTEELPEGVYISKTTVGSHIYNSLTFIGSAKTFNDSTSQVETYILDFNENLYGQEIEVELLEKIRDNKKFNSSEELVKEMESDKKLAEDYFKH